MTLCSGCYRDDVPVVPNPLGFGKPRCADCVLAQERIGKLLSELWALGVPSDRTNPVLHWMAWERCHLGVAGARRQAREDSIIARRACRKCGVAHSGRGADPDVCLACEQAAAVDRIGELKREAQGG